MEKVIYIFIGFAIGGIVGWCIKPDNECDEDDPTGEIKKGIFDKLTTIKEDLQKTV